MNFIKGFTDVFNSYAFGQGTAIFLIITLAAILVVYAAFKIASRIEY